jgi:hypothetical protein
VAVAAGWVAAVIVEPVTEPKAWTAPLGVGMAGADAAGVVTGEDEAEGGVELAAAGVEAGGAGAAP